MSTELPERVDPWRAADKRAAFAGRLPLSRLTRLRGLLFGTSGDVAYRLEFYRDEGWRAIVRGSIRATLYQECQRCLETVAHEADVRIALAVVTDDSAEVPGQHDPLVVEEGFVHPLALIEDELLLDLPQIPRHDPDACSAAVDRPAGAERSNPFAVLADWKRE
jgi:uncharacterized protein